MEGERYVNDVCEGDLFVKVVCEGITLNLVVDEGIVEDGQQGGANKIYGGRTSLRGYKWRR